MSLTDYMPLLQTGLTVGGTLVVAMGTWYFNEKARADKVREEDEQRIAKLKSDLSASLEDHKKVYMTEITNVHNSITDINNKYDVSTQIITLKIDNLEKKQDKHNSVIERTYALEKDVEVLKNRESVSENRLADLERHEEHRHEMVEKNS